jgi:hypothetical protein
MKKSILLLLTISIFISMGTLKAQSKSGSFGFGIVLGEPIGGTIKLWTGPTTALVAEIGASYFGSPRLQVDYTYHFDAFNSDIVKMYAGPGLALGFGPGRVIIYQQHPDRFYYHEVDETGIGVRAIFGLNILPRNTPIELFFEAGPMVGISPAFGAIIDAALGVRFYL